MLLVGLAGFVLLALAYEHEPLASLDADVSESVATSVPGWLEALARPFSWLGGWIGITALTTAAVILLARERNWLDACFVLAAVVGSQIAVAVLKALFDRPRPDAGSAVPLPDSAAFPSGHATAGIAALGALVVLTAERLTTRRARLTLWIGAVVVGLAIGLSRIALNVHYPADVLAGWCFGLAWLAACVLARERLRASG
jgi:undecaprenyl-diphosphatase